MSQSLILLWWGTPPNCRAFHGFHCWVREPAGSQLWPSAKITKTSTILLLLLCLFITPWCLTIYNPPKRSNLTHTPPFTPTPPATFELHPAFSCYSCSHFSKFNLAASAIFFTPLAPVGYTLAKRSLNASPPPPARLPFQANTANPECCTSNMESMDTPELGIWCEGEDHQGRLTMRKWS